MATRVLPQIANTSSPHVELATRAPIVIGFERTRQERSLRQSLVERVRFNAMKTAGNVLSHLSTRPWHRPSIGPAIRAEISRLLAPGDILITRRQYAMTNFVFPSFWPHATLYLGDAESLAAMGLREYEHVRRRWWRLVASATSLSSDDRSHTARVLEARKDGVHIRPLDSPMRSDALAILRPQLEADDIATALARGLRHEGKPYDFEFDFARSDRLVCTEVVYRSYHGLGEIRFQLRRHAGRLALVADDLLRMALEGAGFDAIAVYLPLQSQQLCRGAEARRMLCDSLYSRPA
ncbi:MAG TPA: YiiX/YebB-like N1pC/P60 family cysteine hydrolase [Pirellulales bacterium]|nr:YiiX/YebB-like N1pC/P60 family cysteine hydrolase [Pirellulales bacterium]